jgi:hypothetical protein
MPEPTSTSPTELRLDNTKRSCFNTCRRKFYWQHIRGLKPEFGSTALRFGTTWHGALEGFYSHIKEHGWSEDGKAIHAACDLAKKEWDKETSKQNFATDYRTFEQCMTMFLQYTNHYVGDKGLLKVIETEQVFAYKMELDEFLHEDILFPYLVDTNLFFTGKIDLQVMLSGIRWMVEHKTTSQSLSTQVLRLHRTPQIKGYCWASDKVHDFPVEGCLVSFAHCTSRKSPKTDEYGKVTMDFARTPQIFSEADLEQWRISFLSTANEVAHEMQRNLWPMCEDSCYNYGPCAYSMLCEQNVPIDSVNTAGYIYDPWDVEAE